MCIVDEAGHFTSDAGELSGIDIEDAVPLILDKLKHNIVHLEDHIHSYPYDWRTKKPVIIRCSNQWFIDTEILKEKATVNIYLFIKGFLFAKLKYLLVDQFSEFLRACHNQAWTPCKQITFTLKGQTILVYFKTACLGCTNPHFLWFLF